jgi:hypothetical protein
MLEIPLYHQLLALIESYQPLPQEDRWRADPVVGLTAMSAYQPQEDRMWG